MKLGAMVACLSVAFAGTYGWADERRGESADQVAGVRSNGHSRPPIPRLGLEAGAVYELRLRLAWDDVDKYLSQYARWYLPVDQDKTSGRKLISVVLRETGDQYNLAFTYWYESAYKEDYYCQYTKAFFRLHGSAESDMHDELKGTFKQTLVELGELGSTAPSATVETRLQKTVTMLPDKCSEMPTSLEDEAAETMRKIDQTLAKMVTLDQGTWNFGTSPCKVRMLSDARAKKLKIDEAFKAKLSKTCDTPRLQTALGRIAAGELPWPAEAATPQEPSKP
jgi:hypothetical protein